MFKNKYVEHKSSFFLIDARVLCIFMVYIIPFIINFFIDKSYGVILPTVIYIIEKNSGFIKQHSLNSIFLILTKEIFVLIFVTISMNMDIHIFTKTNETIVFHFPAYIYMIVTLFINLQILYSIYKTIKYETVNIFILNKIEYTLLKNNSVYNNDKFRKN